MRPRAFGLAIALVGCLSASALAQPFSDTRADHWAYTALADLASKGLIQGYPDGSFKGDRTMTRYEMAVAVARLLARIERIQIPTPGAPQKLVVTRVDIDAALRLMHEFQAELAAQDVRTAAIEEELNAIKARVATNTVQISGATEMRYDISRAATGDPVNGNPTTGSTSAGASPAANMAREVLRLQFDGSPAENVHLIAVLITAGLAGTGASTGFVAFNSADYGFPGTHVVGTIDDAFLDWKNAFGLPAEIWLGRFGGSPLGRPTRSSSVPLAS